MKKVVFWVVLVGAWGSSRPPLPVPPVGCPVERCTPYLSGEMGFDFFGREFSVGWRIDDGVEVVGGFSGCVGNGVVVFCGRGNGVVVVNSSGSVLWSLPVLSASDSVPVVDLVGDGIGWNMSFVEFLDHSGSVSWSEELIPPDASEGRRSGPQPTADGLVVFSTRDGRLFGYFGDSTPLGVRYFCGTCESTAFCMLNHDCDSQSQNVFSSIGAIAVANERVFSLTVLELEGVRVTSQCALWATDHQSSINNRWKPIWGATIPNCSNTSSSLSFARFDSQDLIVVGTDSGHVYSFDPWQEGTTYPNGSVLANSKPIFVHSLPDSTTTQRILSAAHLSSFVGVSLSNGNFVVFNPNQTLTTSSLCPHNTKCTLIGDPQLGNTSLSLLAPIFIPATNQSFLSIHTPTSQSFAKLPFADQTPIGQFAATPTHLVFSGPQTILGLQFQ